MIHDFDRSGYFGASDIKYIMATNRTTKSWIDWWSVKLGDSPGYSYNNIYTRAGTLYEHPIVDAIDPSIIKDGQIIYEKYKLRINYDGYLDGNILEVKTYQDKDEFEEPSRNAKGKFFQYWGQCQLQAFVYKELAEEWFLPPFKSITLASYPLHVDEYNVETEEDAIVDPSRIQFWEIKYDKDWIKNECLPRVRELARALRKKKSPI